MPPNTRSNWPTAERVRDRPVPLSSPAEAAVRGPPSSAATGRPGAAEKGRASHGNFARPKYGDAARAPPDTHLNTNFMAENGEVRTVPDGAVRAAAGGRCRRVRRGSSRAPSIRHPGAVRGHRPGAADRGGTEHAAIGHNQGYAVRHPRAGGGARRRRDVDRRGRSSRARATGAAAPGRGPDGHGGAADRRAVRGRSAERRRQRPPVPGVAAAARAGARRLSSRAARPGTGSTSTRATWTSTGSNGSRGRGAGR